MDKPSSAGGGSSGVLVVTSPSPSPGAPSPSVIAPVVHAKAIEQVLLVSTELNPVHVEVVNESYFYAMRRRIGSKKHIKLFCRENPTNMRLESYIFKLKRSEDDGAMVPKKSFLATHTSRWSAYKHADGQCRIRDANPSVGNEKLFTHFIVRVVSEAFDRLNSMERNAMVYDEILRGLGCNSLPTGSGSSGPGSSPASIVQGRRPPERIKLGSVFGQHMCDLPVFRYIYGTDPNQSVTLLVEARTPSQWKPNAYAPPLSERFGSDHNSLRSGFLPAIVLATAQKKSIKAIANPASTKLEPINDNKPQKQQQKKKKNSMLDELESAGAEEEEELDLGGNLDDEDEDGEESRGRSASADDMSGEPLATGRSVMITGRSESGACSTARSVDNVVVMLNSNSEKVVIKKKKKEGGVYGHFFNDVSPDIRSLMMQGYKDNKKLIQREGTKKAPRKIATGLPEEDSHTPQTTLSKMKKKMEGSDHKSAYDKGTKSETEMMDHYNISNLFVERAAIRLQRIWRIRSFHKAIRYLWRRQYAAISVQRVLRGSFGRVYAKILGRLVPIAVSRIQAQYRKHLARLAMAAWLKLIMKAVRIIGPVVRKFATRCIEMWYDRMNNSAIKIQSLMRRYLGHFKYCRVRGHMYNVCIAIPSVVIIQRYHRGRIGRRRAYAQLHSILLVKVDIPCAIIMQRVFRGTRGRLRARHMRFLNRNAFTIQRNMRDHHVEMKRQRRQHIELERWAASNIQRMYRGVLDRERATRRAKHHWYVTVYLPSIVRVQAVARRYVDQHAYTILVKEHRNSTYIKRWYKRMLKRAAYHEQQRLLREVYRGSMASQIQKIVRSFQAKKLFHRMRITDSSERTFAGKIILRAWICFRDRRRFQKLFDVHIAKNQLAVVQKMVAAREQVIADKKEALADLEYSRRTVDRVRERLGEVDLFFTEAEMRCRKIQSELDNLTPEDIDRGWAEAFGTELEGLVNQMTMAREEKRLRTVQLKKAQKEYIGISVEHEELDIELDAINIRELENMDRLRLSEIIAIERRLKEQKDRKIRIEKCRWKISSNRRKIIERVRDEKLKEQVWLTN
jgi:stress-induced morphogen